MLQIKNKIAVR